MGPSTGAACKVACELACSDEAAGKTIVVIFPSSGIRRVLPLSASPASPASPPLPLLPPLPPLPHNLRHCFSVERPPVSLNKHPPATQPCLAFVNQIRPSRRQLALTRQQQITAQRQLEGRPQQIQSPSSQSNAAGHTPSPHPQPRSRCAGTWRTQCGRTSRRRLLPSWRRRPTFRMRRRWSVGRAKPTCLPSDPVLCIIACSLSLSLSLSPSPSLSLSLSLSFSLSLSLSLPLSLSTACTHAFVMRVALRVQKSRTRSYRRDGDSGHGRLPRMNE